MGLIKKFTHTKEKISKNLINFRSYKMAKFIKTGEKNEYFSKNLLYDFLKTRSLVSREQIISNVLS